MKDVAQIGMSIFGLSALAMAYSGRPALMKWSPLVGIAGQPFWAAFAWIVSSWALALLVPAFSAAYLYGIWKQWEVRRWLWRLVRPGTVAEDRCAGCGKRMTQHEREYYVCHCERCEGIAMQEMEGAA